MIAPDFAETLQQANEAPRDGRVNCVSCGIVGGLLTVIAIATCQNWQAIASIFS